MSQEEGGLSEAEERVATCFQLALMVTTGGLHLYLRILSVL